MPSLALVSLLLLLQAAAHLRYDTPAGWVVKPPASRMRLAEFTLPKADGDPEDGSLAIFFFGGQGGSVQANLDRWTQQMAQPDGRPSEDVATTPRLSVGDLALTTVDVPGTYVAETSPGSAERFSEAGFRLRAAVVEGRGGPYFVKLTGPARTIARWDAAYTAFLRSLRVE